MADDTSGGAAAGLSYRLKKCKYGNFLYNQQDAFLGRSFDLYGEYADHELQLLMAMLEPGDFVVDAGANMGADVVPVARRVGPKGHVLAIEPQRIVHQLLCANVALNGLANVTTPWCAVGAKAGETTVPPLAGSAQGSERVPVVPIDQFELVKCALLKVDVGGTELDVLRGADATLKKAKPIVYVENSGGRGSPALIRHLLDLGYYLFWHTPPLFNAKNFAGKADNVFGDALSCSMLCLPPGHPKQAVAQSLRAVLGADDVGLEVYRRRA